MTNANGEAAESSHLSFVIISSLGFGIRINLTIHVSRYEFRSEHHLVHPRRRAVHRLRDARRLRPRHRRAASVHQGRHRAPHRCSTPSGRSGTATKSGSSPAAARCSPRSRTSMRRCSPVFISRSILLLASLIFRAVAIEFRSKQPMRWWRQMWDIGFSAGSIVSAPAHRRGAGQHRLGRAD